MTITTSITKFPSAAISSLFSSSSHLFICIVGGLLCFLPVFGRDKSFLGRSIFAATISDDCLAEISSVVIITLVVPYFADRLIDKLQQCIYMSGHDKRAPSSVSSVPKLCFFANAECFMTMVGLAVPSAVLIWARSHPELISAADATYLVVCARSFRSVLVNGALITSVSRQYPEIFSRSVVTLVLLLYASSSVTSCYLNNLEAAGDPRVEMLDILHDTSPLDANSARRKRIRDGSATSTRVANQQAGSKEGSGGRHVSSRKQFAVNMVDSMSQRTKDDRKPISEENLYSRLYVLVILVYFVIHVSVWLTCGEAVGYTGTRVFAADMVYAFFQVALILLKMRRTKSEVAAGVSALLETKKSYIRYISHELRTPLNSAALGLKLLHDELSSSGLAQDAERVDTINDVSKSVVAAVEILDGLLCFDKLENGIMELRKQDVKIVDFLFDCMKPFVPQAREKGVELQLLTDLDQAITEDGGSVAGRSSGFMRSMTDPFQNRNSITGSIKCRNSIVGSIKGRRKSTFQGEYESSLTDDDVIVLDKFKMAQVMRNLISNALKFSPRNDNGVVEVRAMFITTFDPDLQKKEGLRASGESIIGMPHDVKDIGIDAARDADVQLVEAEEGIVRVRPPLKIGEIGRKCEISRNNTLGKVFSSMRFLVPRVVEDEIDARKENRVKCHKHSSVPKSTQGKLRITVKDSGAGISPENQKRLFTEIVQFNPEVLQAGGGSGMGLLITKGIVDLHGGSISVYSEGEGKGCTFTIELPMKRENDPLATSGNASAVQAVIDSETPQPLGDKIELRSGPRAGEDLYPAIDINQEVGMVTLISRDDIREKSAPLVSADESVPSRSRCESKGRLVCGEGMNFESSASAEDRLSSHEQSKSRESTPGQSHLELSSVVIASDEGDSAAAVDGIAQALATVKIDESVKQKLCALLQAQPEAATAAVTAVVKALSGFHNFTSTPSERQQNSRSPLRLNALSHVSSYSGASPREKETYTGPRYNVLIVDDSDLTRKMLRKTLQAVGHTCDEAEDGLAAVKKVKSLVSAYCGSCPPNEEIKVNISLQNNSNSGASPVQNTSDRKLLLTSPYDCVLMDFVMPNLDGPSASSQLRSMGLSVPIFGVTGNTIESDIQLFMNAGANKVFSKPFSIKKFHKEMYPYHMEKCRESLALSPSQSHR